MKNRLRGQSGRADLWILHASVYIVHDGSRVTTCAVDVSWDPSRYCGVTHIQNKSWQESSESLQQIRQQDEEREYFLHFKKKSTCCTTQAHVMLVTQLWRAIILLHCRHSQIALSSHFLNSGQSSSAVARRLTHSSHWVQTHVNQASRRGLCLSKGTKQNYHALYMISERTLSQMYWMDVNILHNECCCFHFCYFFFLRRY